MVDLKRKASSDVEDFETQPAIKKTKLDPTPDSTIPTSLAEATTTRPATSSPKRKAPADTEDNEDQPVAKKAKTTTSQTQKPSLASASSILLPNGAHTTIPGLHLLTPPETEDDEDQPAMDTDDDELEPAKSTKDEEEEEIDMETDDDEPEPTEKASDGQAKLTRDIKHRTVPPQLVITSVECTNDIKQCTIPPRLGVTSVEGTSIPPQLSVTYIDCDDTESPAECSTTNSNDIPAQDNSPQSITESTISESTTENATTTTFPDESASLVNMPNEIKTRILSYLPYPSLSLMLNTCRTFRTFHSSLTIHKVFLDQKFDVETRHVTANSRFLVPEGRVRCHTCSRTAHPSLSKYNPKAPTPKLTPEGKTCNYCAIGRSGVLRPGLTTICLLENTDEEVGLRNRCFNCRKNPTRRNARDGEGEGIGAGKLCTKCWSSYFVKTGIDTGLKRVRMQFHRKFGEWMYAVWKADREGDEGCRTLDVTKGVESA